MAMRVERALKSVGWLGGNGHGPIIIEAERRRARRRRAREAKRLKGKRGRYPPGDTMRTVARAGKHAQTLQVWCKFPNPSSGLPREVTLEGIW